MIAALALLVAQPVAATPVEDEVMNEIVVIGSKLKKWRGNWRIRNGNVLCRTVKSTGDTTIDAIGCRALVTCVQPRAAELIAARNSDQPRSMRRKTIDRIINQTVPCTARTREAGIDQLARTRNAS